MAQLGFNLLNWTASVSDPHFSHIERLKAIGYDGIEIFTGNRDPAAYPQLNTHLKNLGMGITCVTVLPADANPVSPDPAVRAKAVEALKWNVDRCVDVGSAVLAGPVHSAFATFTRAAPTPDEYARSAEVLHTVGEYAQTAGVMIAIEALNRFECYLCNTMAQLRALVEQADHPSIRAMFDTHHANVEEKDQMAAIRHIAPVLTHVHLSENDRGTPGSGHINFRDALTTLHEIGYDGWLTIESFSRADPDFANAINVWREFSPAWEIAERGYTYLSREIRAAGFGRG